MNTYTLEVFDSRNTALERRYSGRVKGLKDYAKELSVKNGVHKVIAYGLEGFETYEEGRLTEWSLPSGIIN